MTVTVQYKQDRLRNAGGMFTEVYPFSTTKLGKRFIFPLQKDAPDYDLEYSRLRAAAYAFFRRTGKKFKCKQDDRGILVSRIM